MYTFGPVAFLVGLVSSVVTALVGLLSPLAGAAAPALSVVVLTLLVRTALVPVGWSQVRAEFTRRRLAPRLADLRRTYGDRPQRLREETMRLYRDEGTSPLAGCLPALLQAPVFLAVYGLFLSPEVHGEPNTLLAGTVFGVPLGERLMAAAGDPVAVALFAGLGLALGVVAWLQRRTTPPAPVEPETEAAETMQRVTGVLPFLVVVAVPVVPLAAVVYLVTTTTWTLVERVVLRRVLATRQPST
ncbi:YidC/Oxa1 family membrane protein insertase [Haloactinopolyspora alba]|uniref:Membrane protein insertase YidC n=1 Tax=Haloactinopolyspora alba TaxID=648780 RepID=A0A2P8E1C6_9ACTN|nr:membrane protein insertase YidC [Haloactinopolyspora alba]PSL03273.1 YidC/Oxa1 family membrane protein insertase [Haloactinopolyspora alba]